MRDQPWVYLKDLQMVALLVDLSAFWKETKIMVIQQIVSQNSRNRFNKLFSDVNPPLLEQRWASRWAC